MSTNRNELCKCNSGFKYKHCCLPIEKAANEKKLEIAKKIYSRHWAVSSNHFLKKNYYGWMAEQLKKFNPKKIFDIGAGNGNGIIELFKRFESKNLHIVSIDENIKCLKKAAKKIEDELNIKPFLQTRITSEHKGEIYRYFYDPIDYSKDSKMVLLESDFLSDPLLDNVEEFSGKFDAITVWLLGTHQQRHACFHILNQINSSGEYRLRVQNKAFKFSDKILKSGGLLHVVDRRELPEKEFLIEDSINSYKDQASETGLKFDSFNAIEYEEPQKGIKMEINLGESGRIPESFKLGLTSVIFRKL